MKIVILTDKWKGTIGTGIKTYVSNLAEGLKCNERFDTYVVFTNGCDPENIKISGSRFLFPLKAFFVLKSIKPDVIYSQASWYFPMASIIYKKFYRAKNVVTVHSYPGKKLPFYLRYLMSYLLNNSNVVTFVSKGLEDRIKTIWQLRIKTRTEITYPGVTPRIINDVEINKFYNKYKIPKNSIILLSQSSPMARVKADGAKLLMTSIKDLSHIYPNIILIITGVGPFMGELEKFSKNENIEKHIIFTGWIENPFIPLEVCDIFMQVSYGEGLPLALLEAMSAGKPVIGTPVGGIPEIIENRKNGLLVDLDKSSLSDGITFLLENPDTAYHLGQEAKKMAGSKFTWNNSVKKMAEIFESL